MTIVISIRCVDGIVIASDSQVGFERGVSIKRLNANKMYQLGDSFIVAGAGAVAHIRKAVDAINFTLEEKKREKGSTLTEDECVDTLEKTVLALHKEYNIDRSKLLDVDEREYFSPILVFGAKAIEEKETNFYSGIVHGDGTVEPVEDYGTVGSGAAFAEMLLKNFWIKDITVNEAMAVAAYTINEVIEIAPDCGGLTKLGVLQKDTVKVMEGTEVTCLLQKVQPALKLISTELVPRILRGDASEEDVAKLLAVKKSAASSSSHE